MAIVTAYLKGYQVLPSILGMKPFGHLFIEYVLEESEEEARIFRAGPVGGGGGGYLYVWDTFERLSIDSHLRIISKKPICIIKQQINLNVRNRSYNEKLFAWSQFIN